MIYQPDPRLFGQEKGAAVLSSEDLKIRELLKENPRTAESKITEIVELLDGTLEVNTVRNVSPPMGEVIHLTRSGPHRWRIEEEWDSRRIRLTNLCVN